jgi:uncharacterized protein (AIM24 family)
MSRRMMLGEVFGRVVLARGGPAVEVELALIDEILQPVVVQVERCVAFQTNLSFEYTVSSGILGKKEEFLWQVWGVPFRQGQCG